MSNDLKSKHYSFAKLFNICMIVAVLLAFNAWVTQARANDAAVEEQIQQAEMASQHGPYPNDGAFTGEAMGFGGMVKMQAVIENGYISSVEILDASHEDEAWLNMAIVLVDQIVKEQTTDLDVVSGATYSSAGILNGTTEALKQSMGEA